MFYDTARIWVKGGDGGKGAISFRREKYVPNGGPDGGDGGDGGDVILVGDAKLDSLLDFNHKQRFEAEAGGAGSKRLCHGKKGKTLRIKVPLGTVIWMPEKQEMLGEVVDVDQEFIAARGGKGGRGNYHFVTAVKQAPRRADPGIPGEYKELLLELKLIADIGLVGLPNAGKSTLLRLLTAATPEVGEFPFTTKRPFLGVLDLGDFKTVTLADLPGMVEGAHQGKGLGISFLRHAERCPLLVLVVDAAKVEGSNPADNADIIINELSSYKPELVGRIKIVVANKMDLGTSQVGLRLLKERFENISVLPISALKDMGISSLIDAIKLQMSDANANDA